MPGRLNSLQRTMLQWNDLHPYNAVHVARVPGVLDEGHLREVISRGLGRRGLTSLTLDAAAGTYEYRGGSAAIELQSLAAGEGTIPEVADEIERQLNTGFAAGEPFTPFRFFAARGRNVFSLGLVYFHAVADAEAIVLLLKELVQDYLGSHGIEVTPELYPPVYDNLLRHWPAILLKRLGAFPAQTARLRRTCRPPCRDAQDPRNGFTFLGLESRQLAALRAAGKAWGVTLNDLFLALLLEAVALLAPGRPPAARRRKLAVGCIVNTRKDLGVDSPQTFGLFLGSFMVTHDAPAGIGLSQLAADVGRETRRIKAARLYLGMPVELAVTRLLLARAPVERQRKFYPKHYPLWGGITNMNLNALWPPAEGVARVDYFRAVSTGPATPLVLSITTSGDRINIGLTYRSAVYSPADIERIKARLVEQIGQLETDA